MDRMMYRLIANFVSPPVSMETKNLLRNAREALPDQFRTDNQFLGYQYAGCGATIGVMPRCDFACRGCYLGREANRIAPESVVGIKRQLRVIRGWLGEGGNVQITDGEATLRPIEEIIEIIRYARDIGLVPMLMTHGDSFRASPGMLKRLMQEGGLTEVSIHIDTTQRGRSGRGYKYAESEQQLMPLRNEFAQMIRSLRKETGRTLEVATTFTVTDENISDVADVVRWMGQNADAFKMISFQPVAQVGRTEEQLGESLTVNKLWVRIAEGLYGDKDRVNELMLHQGLFGHPDCTRFVQGAIVTQSGSTPVFHPLFREDDTNAIQLFKEIFHRFGGISFRRFSPWQKIHCLINLLIQNPKFILLSLLPFVLQRLRDFDGRSARRLIAAWLLGRTQVHYLNIVSHHFMSRAEIETPLGQERIAACVFKVPINDSLVSMCEVNALGYREKYYDSIRMTG